MDEIFLIHNLFRHSVERFKKEDPQLKRLKEMPYVYSSPLKKRLAGAGPGIYTLSGGRQVGKSTLMKQLMLYLLKEKRVPPENMMYMTGEVIDGQKVLLEHIQDFLDSMKSSGSKQSYLFIDEVTYIDSWHRAVKFLADTGQLDSTVVFLTGSDMLFLKDMVKMLPGRRGRDRETDFHYYPLSFRDYLYLKGVLDRNIIEEITNGCVKSKNEKEITSLLYDELRHYLITGGYMTAINDYEKNGKVSPYVKKIYVDWIFGDFLKRNKQERYLHEILTAILKRSGSQITWNSLAADLSIDHHKTVSEYAEILSSMDALFIQPALREDRLCAAPKKAKKLHFTDPFIVQSLCGCLELALPEESLMIESALASHIRRKFPTYYIKNKGEIDIAYVKEKEIMPVEVKWTEKIKPVHLKLLKKYKNSVLGAKVYKQSLVEDINIIPLVYLFIRFS